MSKIKASDLHAQWQKDDPDYQAAYDALDEEFSLASALIEARTRAGLSQEALALRMGTSQSAVARMESGKTLPSSRSLQRYAAATGSRLRISLVRG